MADTEQPTGGRRAIAFDDFRKQHREYLYRAVTSLTREPDTAVEAVDKAMAQAAQRWDVLSEYAQPAGWVWRIALRRSQAPSSRLRRLASRRTAPDRSRLPDPEVNDAVAALPYRLRVVLVARFYLGWSTQQIGGSLHLQLHTVDRRLGRGLRRINRALDSPS